MGQYFLAVNCDKREFIHAHAFGDGLKFYEMCGSSDGVLAGLAHLLCQTNDPTHKSAIVGSWAQNNITLVGDYDSSGLYATAMEEYKDVSFDLIRAMCCRDSLKYSLHLKTAWRRGDDDGDLLSDQGDRDFYKEIFDGFD